MANIPGEIVWQANDNTWFTNNAAEVYPAGITIYHVDGRYKFTDGVTTLGALPFRGDGGTETQNLQDVTDNGANTTNQMQINGVNVATVNDIPSLSGYVDTAGLTTNYIPKATASDTIGDSSITDDGTKVTVNGGFYATTGASEIFVYGDTAYITADGQTNTNIESNLTENILRHNVKNTFNAPANNFPQLTPSQIVVTDASKNLVSVAKATGYNLALGTAAGTVLEGNRITQTITNGVTDKVPSEDAVFDALALKLTQNNFTDITGSCTIVGWASYTTNSIRAVDMGDYYIVTGYIVGTSNSITTTVQMPYTNNGHRQGYSGYGVSNGTSVFTRVLINGASDTIDFRTGSAGNAWAATGTKEITFNLIIEK